MSPFFLTLPKAYIPSPQVLVTTGSSNDTWDCPWSRHVGRLNKPVFEIQMNPRGSVLLSWNLTYIKLTDCRRKAIPMVGKQFWRINVVYWSLAISKRIALWLCEKHMFLPIVITPLKVIYEIYQKWIRNRKHSKRLETGKN